MGRAMKTFPLVSAGLVVSVIAVPIRGSVLAGFKGLAAPDVRGKRGWSGHHPMNRIAVSAMQLRTWLCLILLLVKTGTDRFVTNCVLKAAAGRATALGACMVSFPAPTRKRIDPQSSPSNYQQENGKYSDHVRNGSGRVGLESATNRPMLTRKEQGALSHRAPSLPFKNESGRL
jgi:hypothetical protein